MSLPPHPATLNEEDDAIPSVPEPAPKLKGQAVTQLLIKELDRLRDQHDHFPLNSAFMAAKELVRARDAFGRAKYGQPLMTGDGRDSVEDALQEMGDLLQYAFKARLNGESLAKVRELLPVLIEICGEDAGTLRFLQETAAYHL